MPHALDGIVDAIQASLKNHWAMVLLYETQSEHFTRWGYERLGRAFRVYAEDERNHARKCLARLEFFDAAPECVVECPAWPRHDLEGILLVNYTLDITAANDERAGLILATAAGDAGSFDLFSELLQGSEEGMAEIEAVRLVIDQVGIDNFLADQS